jgi:hypothetical protein
MSARMGSDEWSAEAVKKYHNRLASDPDFAAQEAANARRYYLNQLTQEKLTRASWLRFVFRLAVGLAVIALAVHFCL